ncbi:hypothetical protein N9L17_00445 [Candidatus Pelagibacter bacterium]|jgi:hypothetical protein|nr:hypothetical protein [Candidatus Pelagibacter bacterium]
MKKKIYDIIVVGSGLSSLAFIDSYLEKKNNINIISFKKTKKIFPQINNKHILKILPPQMIGEEKQVLDYFSINKIIIENKTKLFGSLEFGGLSNYWGLQIDKNIKKDLISYSTKTQKKIIDSFIEIFNKQNLLGEFDKYTQNLFKKNPYIDEKFLKKNKLFKTEEPILAFQKKKEKKKIDLNLINEKKESLTANNFFKKNLKKKKIIFHNYFVEKISQNKKEIFLHCSNGLQKKIFITKKLVLGCGTLATTRLIMDYLKINTELKINHHPRLFSLYFSKKKWINKMHFQPSHFHLKLRKNPSLFTADFRPGNKLIIDAVIKFKKILSPIKFLLNLFREHFIFSNVFIHPKYSNLYIKRQKSHFLVYSKKNYHEKLFKAFGKKIYIFLKSSKKILPIYINYFPGYGADFHYFGTLLMGNSKKSYLNENCQLNKNKNIYIVDGSVFKFKNNKYPLGVIMANARRIGKEI